MNINKNDINYLCPLTAYQSRMIEIDDVETCIQHIKFQLYDSFDELAMKQCVKQLVKSRDYLKSIIVYNKLARPLNVYLKDSIRECYINISELNSYQFSIEKTPWVFVGDPTTGVIEFYYNQLYFDEKSTYIIGNELIQLYMTGKLSNNRIQYGGAQEYHKFVKEREKEDYKQFDESLAKLKNVSYNDNRPMHNVEIGETSWIKLSLAANLNEIYISWASVMLSLLFKEECIIGISKCCDDVQGELIGNYSRVIPYCFLYKHDKLIKDMVDTPRWDTSVLDFWSYRKLSERNISLDSCIVLSNRYDRKNENKTYKIMYSNEYDERLFLQVESNIILELNVSEMNNQVLEYRILSNRDMYEDEIMISVSQMFYDTLVQITDEKTNYLSEICYNNHEMSYSSHELERKELFYLKDSTEFVSREAIIDIQRNQTYKFERFDDDVDRLSGYLRKTIYKDEEHPVIGIMMERSYEMLVAIYAVMKSGGTYMPIDHNYPVKRKEYMIENSKCKLVIADYIDHEFSCNILQYNDFMNLVESLEKDCSIYAKIDEPAYLLYTSGSTGKPKGVLITHRAIQNRIDWICRYAKITSVDTMLFKTPYTFDVSVIEILVWKYSGCKICILPLEEHKNPDAIKKAMIANNITIVHFVPSMLKAFSFYHAMKEDNDLGNLRYIFTSGEALEQNHIQQVSETFRKKNPDFNILNLYGPTEAAVDVSYYLCSWEKEEIIPIGMPIDNVKLYCMDPLYRMLPRYIEGQLAIAGVCLAKEYINNKEMTEQRFIKHEASNQRIYLTGDKAYWRTDNNLIFGGRIDTQVKIRGLRVELSEIKNVILDFPEVHDAEVILAGSKDSESYIVAFVVAETELNIEKLLGFVESNVAEYMIPKQVIKIDEIPVNNNGKTDVNALKEMIHNEQQTSLIDKEDSIYQVVLELWRKIIGDRVHSEEDDFFTIGGDSIKAIYLLTEINHRFGLNWMLEDIFSHSTLCSQVEYIKEKNQNIQEISSNETMNNEVPLEEKSYIVNSTQKRMYYMSKFDQNSSYNIMGVYKIENNNIDINKLEQAIQKVLERHPVLRTSYDIQNDNVVAYVHDDWTFNVEIIELEETITVDEYLDQNTIKFDLSKPLLFHIKYLKKMYESYLVFEFNHILVDGISLSIIMEEIELLYRSGETKLSQAYPYSLAIKEKKDIHKEYWLNEFKEIPDSVVLQEDYIRPEQFTFLGDSVVSDYNNEDIKLLANKYSTTPAVIFLSVLASCIYKMSNYKKFVIGVVVSGRDSLNTQCCIGPFVNTLPFHFQLEENMTVSDIIMYTHAKMLNGLQYQSYPTEELLNELKIERESDRSPLFNVMFTYQADFSKEFSLNDVPMKEYPYKQKSAKMDLSLFVHENSGKMELEYCTEIFHRHTIESFKNRMLMLIDWFRNNNDETIAGFNLLLESERINISQCEPEYHKNLTLQMQFAEAARKYSDREAIIFKVDTKDIRYTYKKLDQLSDKCMLYLKEQGVTNDSIVAIQLENSPETIISILAVLKLGATYLPIDVTIPTERCEFMFRELDVHTVICEDMAYQYDVELRISRSELQEAFNREYDTEARINSGKGEDLCYVIFTSGSTGKPKGCLLSQSNVSDYINWAIQYYFNDYKEQVYFSMFTSISVDLTVTSIFTPLLSGNTIVIYPNDIESIYKIFSDGYTNIVKMTPSHMKMLAGYDFKNSKVKKIIVGGEQLTKSICSLIKIPGIRFYNEYGPTETTVGCMIYEYNPENKNELRSEVIPIGTRLDHTRIYVLDQYGNLCPNNVHGEIYIGGSTVAMGYTDAQVTAERFVKNMIQPEDINLLFRTGDYAYWNYEHELVYVGRKDEQKKVRGNRIEIAEIDACIQRSNLILNSYTYINEDTIVSCVVGNENYTKRKLMHTLKQWLPSYMIPNKIVELESLPIKPSGKIDESKVSSIVAAYKEVIEEVNKDDDMLHAIIKIWSNVLQHNNFTVSDSFFDVGGNSVLLMSMHKDIQKLNAKIQLADYFKYPSIAELVDYLQMEAEITEKVNVLSWCKKNIAENIDLSNIEYAVDDTIIDNLYQCSMEYNISEIEVISAICFVLLSKDSVSDKLSLDIISGENHTILYGNKTGSIDQVIEYLSESKVDTYEADATIAITNTTDVINDKYDIVVLYNQQEVSIYYNVEAIDYDTIEEMGSTLLDILESIK